MKQPLLSIIIPAYNAEPYIDKLINALKPQVTTDTEVIVVDDGSKMPYTAPYKWVHVIRQNNGGASAARNTGLDTAKGKYIAFIDADDLVSANYLDLIRAKIAEGCDYIYLSWQTIGNGWQAKVILKNITDVFPPDNLCVWNRVYKRSIIGDIRFNTSKLIAEDAEFIRKVETDGYKKGIISEPIYLYRSDTPDSLSKRFAAGTLDTKRIVYYYNRVTPDMTYLLDDFAADDAIGEVILMTNSNQIPELKKYAMVIAPRRIRTTHAKGEPCNLIELIEPPIKTQVVIWTSYAQSIGGIETFTYNFAKTMSKYYDIIVLYDKMDFRQIDRVSRYVECRKNNVKRAVECDFLIVNRIIDKIPENIHAKKTIQMVHGAKIDYATVPQDKDIMICVSKYVKKSWGDKAKRAQVIHNIMDTDTDRETPLLLVTASRLEAADKGLKRMIKLAKLMEEQNIPYIWLCFSNKGKIADSPKNMVWMGSTLDIIPWIKKADYLVQLSDTEAFGYSIVEALEQGTAIITTPLEVLPELNVKDGKHGYIVPWDIDGFDCQKLLNVPQFTYKTDSEAIITQWRNIFGYTQPKHAYKPQDRVSVQIIKPYKDLLLNRMVSVGEVIMAFEERANEIINAGFGRRV